MPKAILEFNLPEEQEELAQAQKGGEYLAIIEELDNFLRAKMKYESDSLTDEQYHVYEEVRKKLWELRENNE